ncbi:MAG: cytochrome c oxidase subunit 3 [Desulfatitalea sp.]|nr:cytochrome c oxidase subunit 3 [Desulfatitalea sp.]
MLDTVKARPGSTASDKIRHLPGEAGLWMFISGDVMVFSLFFGVFMYYFGLDPETFHSCQAHLNQTLAAINTVLLLTSSWFVVSAVAAARKNNAGLSSFCLICAFICGLGFCIIKFFEYREKVNDGVTINANEFWTLYFMYTGIHLTHVLVGLGVLAFMIRMSGKGVFDTKNISFMESGASYWHMVDLLWIGLFGFLYLVK